MVSSGCDVNGDGYEDLLVGDRDYDHLAVRDDHGRAWLFLGSSSGLSATPSLTFYPPFNNTYGFFGGQVACAGDVNNDGYEGSMVPWLVRHGIIERRRCICLSRAAGGWRPTWMATEFHNASLISLDSAGDVNGDGYDDIVPVPGLYSSSGRMRTCGAAEQQDWAQRTASNADWLPPNAGNGFGRTVRVGDVNGDGYDIMVGDYADMGPTTGSVHVWYGSASG
jgi:hypothetical protein